MGEVSHLQASIPASLEQLHLRRLHFQNDRDCQNKAITVIQNARQDYFYERALYYLCRTITSQGKKGEI